MDPVTHAATGLLASQAVRRFLPGTRLLLPACLAAALFPDLDNFTGGDPEKYLIQHRALSHALTAAPVLAALLAGTWKLLVRDVPLRKAWLLMLGLVLGHLWLDYVTSYGTQLLAPFSNTRFTLESVFIVDPVFTAGLLLAALAAWRLPGRRTSLALAGLVWLLAYPLASWSCRLVLESRLETALRHEGRQFLSLRLSPEAFTPWYWKGVLDLGETYELSLIRVQDADKTPSGTIYTKADKGLLDGLGREADVFKTYEWFSRYPAVIRTLEGDHETLIFQDLRFVRLHPLVRAVTGDGREPFFTLTAVLDPRDGRLLEYRLRQGGVTFRSSPSTSAGR